MEYIKRGFAICVADYAADEHPYDKNPQKPESFASYNQGWNDACDYIRTRLEPANAGQNRNGRKIFEGDVLRWSHSDGDNDIFCLLHNNGAFWLCGNIHDNPELIGGDCDGPD